MLNSYNIFCRGTRKDI